MFKATTRLEQNSELRSRVQRSGSGSFSAPKHGHTLGRNFAKGLYVLAFVTVQSAETQHQILDQIQTTAVQSQRALSVARQQTTVKERERRILQLTIDEIDHMESDVNLYKGVGKMFVGSLCRRFIFVRILTRIQVPYGPSNDDGTRTQGSREGAYR
jgi:hypothetical protein